jgi:hypothetical protein
MNSSAPEMTLREGRAAHALLLPPLTLPPLALLPLTLQLGPLLQLAPLLQLGPLLGALVEHDGLQHVAVPAKVSQKHREGGA